MAERLNVTRLKVRTCTAFLLTFVVIVLRQIVNGAIVSGRDYQGRKAADVKNSIIHRVMLRVYGVGRSSSGSFDQNDGADELKKS